MPVDSRSAARNRASRRVAKAITGVTSVAATGVVTVTAGFLDDLQPGDIVTLSAKTGGSSLADGTDYFVGVNSTAAGSGALFAAAATTCILFTDEACSTPATHGSNLTAGTLTKGKLTNAADGVLQGDIIAQRSASSR